VGSFMQAISVITQNALIAVEAKMRSHYENRLNPEQIEHVLDLVRLVLLYVGDCNSSRGAGCATCPLGVPVTRHTNDLPDLPSGIILCNLFDYISQNRRSQYKTER
jgi:hypothetical protein